MPAARHACLHIPTPSRTYVLRTTVAGSPPSTEPVIEHVVCERCLKAVLALLGTPGALDQPAHDRPAGKPPARPPTAPSGPRREDVGGGSAERHRPAPRPTARWLLTPHAIEGFAYALRDTRGANVRRPYTPEELEAAADRLAELVDTAKLRATDAEGRELYRSPKSSYGLRWVVSHSRRSEGNLPQVVWVGLGRPPEQHWTADDGANV